MEEKKKTYSAFSMAIIEMGESKSMFIVIVEYIIMSEWQANVVVMCSCARVSRSCGTWVSNDEIWNLGIFPRQFCREYIKCPFAVSTFDNDICSDKNLPWGACAYFTNKKWTDLSVSTFFFVIFIFIPINFHILINFRHLRSKRTDHFSCLCNPRVTSVWSSHFLVK